MNMVTCPGYMCISCVDGNCPIARSDDYSEYGLDVIDDCSECPKYQGCDGCVYRGTQYCVEPNPNQKPLPPIVEAF